MGKKIILNLRIEKDDFEKIKQLIEKGEFENVSQFIRKAIKDKLKEYVEVKTYFS